MKKTTTRNRCLPHHRGRSAVVSLALTVLPGSLTGCGSAPGPTVATPAGGTSSATQAALSAPALVQRESSAAGRDVALAELAPELAQAIVGPLWAPLLQDATLAGSDWQTWLSRHASVSRTANARSWSVALNAEQLKQLLDAFDAAKLPFTSLRMPPRWQQRLAPTFVAEKRWLVCQLRQEKLAEQCDENPPLEARLGVADLVNSVRLQAVFPEGLPVRVGGESVSELPVRLAELVDGQLLALPNMPLQLRDPQPSPQPSVASATLTSAALPPGTPERTLEPAGEDGAEEVSDEWAPELTNEQGVCRFPAELAQEGMLVEVAAEAVLGPLSQIAPFPDLQVSERPLAASRNAVVRVHGTTRADILQVAFERTLTETFGRVPATLPDEVATRLSSQWAKLSDEGSTLDEATRDSIVHSTHGTVDYLLVLDGHSEFASQMGAGRTWYEAQGTLRVFEVWSGKLVGSWEENTTRAGIGDQAAQHTAESAVGEVLAGHLRSLNVL